MANPDNTAACDCSKHQPHCEVVIHDETPGVLRAWCKTHGVQIARDNVFTFGYLAGLIESHERKVLADV